MANPAKRKGDRAEREAVQVLTSLAPDLVLPDAQRMLGAGRRDDVGDLRVFADTAIQVRCYAVNRLGIAIRSSAADAVTQATNGRVPYALGMVPVPGARKDTVRWLACVENWPGELRCPPLAMGTVAGAVAWLRDEGPQIPRTRRVVLLGGARDGRLVHVAPIEAWLAAYRTATQTAAGDAAAPAA